MTDDEQSIRHLVTEWLDASSAGDVASALALMDEEVVFLQPGQEPLRGRDAFAEGFNALLKTHRLEALSDIQEIHISGHMAYCWNHLSVTIFPHDGTPSKTRSGHILSVLLKSPEGHWRIFRDANMLSAVS